MTQSTLPLDGMPRLIRDLPFGEYLALPGLNSSTLKWGDITMKHLQAAVAGEIDDDDTADRKFGRNVHCRLLEPERYARDVKVAKRCAARLSARSLDNQEPKQCRNTGTRELDGVWFCGIQSHAPDEATEPAEYVTKEEGERIERMADSLHGHEVMPLFRAPGWCEVSVQFTCMGNLIKGRLDKFSERGPEIFDNRPTILDIKKMRVGRGDKPTLQKEVLDRGYHRQAAIYVDGVAACGFPEAEFVWIFIEDKPPFDIALLRAHADDIAVGRFEYRQILDNWNRSNRTGVFHGYTYSLQQLQPGALPEWYREGVLRSCDVEHSFAGAGTGAGDDSEIRF